MDIFRDDEDRSVFMNRLYENLYPENIKDNLEYKQKKYKRKLLPPGSFELIAYCLMPNHFHLVIRQLSELAVSDLILKICTGYSMFFNKKYERVGSLFQDTFKMVNVDTNAQLLWLSLYVHENPIKAQLVVDLKDYKWSSYLSYIGKDKGICKSNIILDQYSDPKNYLEYFKNKKTRSEIENMMIGSEDILIDN